MFKDPVEFLLLIVGSALGLIAILLAGQPHKRPRKVAARFGILCAVVGDMFCLPVMRYFFDAYQTGDRAKQAAAIWLGTRVGLVMIVVSIIATLILWKTAFPPKNK